MSKGLVRLRAAAALVVSAALLALPAERTVRLSPPSGPIPPSFFGMHMHPAGEPARWPAVPFGAWRLWDASVAWPDLEPHRDAWHFDKLDQYLDLAEQHHVAVLLVLGLTPQWASAHPREKSAYRRGFAAEPKDLDDWRVYVRTIAQRYRGRIEAYEIWNEPDLRQTWAGSVEQMVMLARIASEVIRGIDPQALIVSPSATSQDGLKWLAEFLSKGGGKQVDVIGYHFRVTPKPPEAIVPLVEQLRLVMNKGGVGDMPIWNTEMGWANPKPFPSEELPPAYVARSFILDWAAGVQRLYWYAWDSSEWDSLHTAENDNQALTPAGKAYDAMFRWLAGARMEQCSSDREQTWICELEREGTRQWIVWNERGQRSFLPPSEWHAAKVEPLLGEPRAIAASSVEIGLAPVLISARAL